MYGFASEKFTPLEKAASRVGGKSDCPPSADFLTGFASLMDNSFKPIPGKYPKVIEIDYAVPVKIRTFAPAGR